jgi:molecular chaperone GrpE
MRRWLKNAVSQGAFRLKILHSNIYVKNMDQGSVIKDMSQSEEKRMDTEAEESRQDDTGKAEESVTENENGGKTPEEMLEQKKRELEECEDRVLRLAAELDNFKKRIEREKVEHMKYALESFAKELLPFLDNLERAIESAKDSGDAEKLIEGIELSLSGYFKVIEKFGLKVFDAEGQPFDPEKHEALTVEPSDDFEDNTVIKELLRGYTLHDRVLRPAMVIVAKNN